MASNIKETHTEITHSAQLALSCTQQTVTGNYTGELGVGMAFYFQLSVTVAVALSMTEYVSE